MVPLTCHKEIDLEPGETSSTPNSTINQLMQMTLSPKYADAPSTPLIWKLMLILQGFLSRFLQTGDQFDLAIAGDSASTLFASLQPALANLRLAAQLRGK
jgi:hypothetical protein